MMPRADGDLGTLESTSGAPDTLSCAAGVETIGALLRGTKIGLSIFMASLCVVVTACQCVSFRSLVFRESVVSALLSFICFVCRKIKLIYFTTSSVPLINGAVDVVAKVLLLRRCCCCCRSLLSIATRLSLRYV